MPRTTQIVKDMEIDEISLVDRAACPPASVVIAKRADGEEAMSDYVDEQGQPVDLEDLKPGDRFEGEDGQWLEIVEDEAEEPELVGVGKSAFFSDSSDIVKGIQEALSKALTDDDRSEVLSKALGDLSKRADAAESRAARSEVIAKSERDLRLTREYISKAAEYNVPIDPNELGPVLMRMSAAMPYEDCAIINKALSAAGEMLFSEVGFDGLAGNDGPAAQFDAFLNERIEKSATPMSKAQGLVSFFDENPEAYDAIRLGN